MAHPNSEALSGNLDLDSLVTTLHDIGGVKFGEFKLKSGAISPIYFDLRIIISYPELLKSVSSLVWKKAEDLKLSFDVLCGIPYTALPVATIVSSLSEIPMILKRKEAKTHGTKQMVEGGFKPSQRCLLIEDVVTTGSSIIETAIVLRAHELVVTDVISILDRGQGARENLAHHGITLHSILNVPMLLGVLQRENILSDEKHTEIMTFLNKNLTSSDLEITTKVKLLLENVQSENGRKLLEIMLAKKSNLCISFDLDTWWEVLDAVERLGPIICVAKTHLDIYNFDSYEQILEFRRRILDLSEKHSFLILEDRKYCDIGNTVKKQLSSKPFEVSKWAHMVTAHGISGNGILKCFTELPSMSTVLIAEMSSQRNLTTKIPTYSSEVYEMTVGFESVVTGFVAQSKIRREGGPAFLQFTPGVSLVAQSDQLDQQYTTIEEAIETRFADVIIVGRGILGQGKELQVATAEEYRTKGWLSWTKRLLNES